MPLRLKSAVLLAFCAVFFFNTSVFGVVLSAELYVHQLAQLEKIKKKKHKDIIELRIDKQLVESRNEQFQWEKDWEFRWLGEMYDIEDSFLDGETWVFFVKHDTKEDMLRKNMDRHAQDENTKRNAQLKKNLKGTEYFEQVAFVVQLYTEAILQSPEPESNLGSIHSVIPDPPPWLS